MAINLPNQFQKLRDTVLKARKLYWSDGKEEYLDPVNPITIVTMSLLQHNKSVNYLLLAERVPARYISWDPKGLPMGTVCTELDANFELMGWHLTNKILKEIARCLCTDGILEGDNIDGVNIEGDKVYFYRRSHTSL